MPELTIEVPGGTLYIDPADRYAETWFADTGKIAPARPEDTESYRQSARDYGYAEDTWAFCRDHEFLHSCVCELLNQPHSLILRLVSEGRETEQPEETAREERLVLDVQLWLRTGECSDLLWETLADHLSEIRERVEAVKAMLEG